MIARARMTRPYLIVLDEPCAGMDPGARENFLATLGRIAQPGKNPGSDLCHPSCRRNSADFQENSHLERWPGSSTVAIRRRVLKPSISAGTLRHILEHHQKERAFWPVVQ